MGRRLFAVAKDWKQSDQGEKIEVSRQVRLLIDDWKVKYWGKVIPGKVDQATPQAA